MERPCGGSVHAADGAELAAPPAPPAAATSQTPAGRWTRGRWSLESTGLVDEAAGGSKLLFLRRIGLGAAWVFIIGTFGPQLRTLWLHADPLGRSLLRSQAAVLALLRLGGKRLPKRLLDPPAVVVPALSLAALVAGAVLHQLRRPLAAKALLQNVIVWGGLPVLHGSLDRMLENLGDADHPALLSMSLGLLLNEPVAATLILVMLTGGDALEEFAMDRAQTNIRALLEQEPGMARQVREDGGVEQVPATDLVPGDVLVLRPGDSAPVDCEVATARTAASEPRYNSGGGGGGQSFEVDESIITGEALPQRKLAGDSIMSGSISLSAQPLTVRVLRAHSSSTMTLFKKSLAAALENKSQLERSSIKIAADFTPFTLAMCAFAFMWQTRAGGPRACASPRAVWGRVLAVMMAATPCPAAIGVPIAFLSGMSASSRQGISIKSGTALENLGKATVCVLDKTGTLTYGRPAVNSVGLFSTEGCDSHNLGSASRSAMTALNKDQALQLVASLEQAASSHPLAAAIMAHARDRGLELCKLDSVAVSESRIGQGLEGFIDGFRVRIGNAEYVFGGAPAICHEDTDSGRGSGMSLARQIEECATRHIEGCAEGGGSAMISTLVAYFDIEVTATASIGSGGGCAKGWICCHDKLRSSSISMVQQLQEKHKLRCVILSGDRTAALHKVANQLSVPEFHSCLPHEKAERVQQLMAQGEVVIMLGDGINDAPALAAASVGVSIGSTDLASESADVVFLASTSSSSPSDSPVKQEPTAKLLELVALAQKVHRGAWRGVLGGMAISVCQMIAAAFGWLPPQISALLQEVLDLSVFFFMYKSSRTPRRRQVSNITPVEKQTSK